MKNLNYNNEVTHIIFTGNIELFPRTSINILWSFAGFMTTLYVIIYSLYRGFTVIGEQYFQQHKIIDT